MLMCISLIQPIKKGRLNYHGSGQSPIITAALCAPFGAQIKQAIILGLTRTLKSFLFKMLRIPKIRFQKQSVKTSNFLLQIHSNKNTNAKFLKPHFSAARETVRIFLNASPTALSPKAGSHFRLASWSLTAKIAAQFVL